MELLQLRKLATARGRRLVVLFASQAVLEVVEQCVGAQLAAASLGALTSSAECVKQLKVASAALLHETVAAPAEVEAASATRGASPSAIAIGWEIRRLLRQGCLVVAYQPLLLPVAAALVDLRLAPRPPAAAAIGGHPGRVADPQLAPAVAAALAAPETAQFAAQSGVADRGLAGRAEAEAPTIAADVAAREPELVLMVGAHLLKHQGLLRGLEALGVRILERELLAPSLPDVLLAPRVCGLIRGLGVLVKPAAAEELTHRVQQALLSFDEVLLIVVLGDGGNVGEEDLSPVADFIQALQLPCYPEGKSVRVVYSIVADLPGLLHAELRQCCHESSGWAAELLAEPELPQESFLAALPGLSAHVAHHIARSMPVGDFCALTGMAMRGHPLYLGDDAAALLQAALDLNYSGPPGASSTAAVAITPKAEHPPARCLRRSPPPAGVSAPQLNAAEAELLQTPFSQAPAHPQAAGPFGEAWGAPKAAAAAETAARRSFEGECDNGGKFRVHSDPRGSANWAAGGAAAVGGHRSEYWGEPRGGRHQVAEASPTRNRGHPPRNARREGSVDPRGCTPEPARAAGGGAERAPPPPCHRGPQAGGGGPWDEDYYAEGPRRGEGMRHARGDHHAYGGQDHYKDGPPRGESTARAAESRRAQRGQDHFAEDPPHGDRARHAPDDRRAYHGQDRYDGGDDDRRVSRGQDRFAYDDPAPRRPRRHEQEDVTCTPHQQGPASDDRGTPESVPMPFSRLQQRHGPQRGEPPAGSRRAHHSYEPSGHGGARYSWPQKPAPPAGSAQPRGEKRRLPGSEASLFSGLRRPVPGPRWGQPPQSSQRSSARPGVGGWPRKGGGKGTGHALATKGGGGRSWGSSNMRGGSMGPMPGFDPWFEG